MLFFKDRQNKTCSYFLVYYVDDSYRFINGAFNLAHMLFYNHNYNWVKPTQFCCLVCGLSAPGKLLPIPKEAVAVWLVELSCATLTKSFKEAVSDPV